MEVLIGNREEGRGKREKKVFAFVSGGDIWSIKVESCRDVRTQAGV
jgi:hypothetical protein